LNDQAEDYAGEGGPLSSVEPSIAYVLNVLVGWAGDAAVNEWFARLWEEGQNNGNINDDFYANRISEKIDVSSEQASLARQRPEDAENGSKNRPTIYDGMKLTQRGR
jgi:hypothetical protein